MERGDVVMVLTRLSVYDSLTDVKKPHVVEEVYPSEGRVAVRPKSGKVKKTRIVLQDELIPWRDGLNWDLERLRLLKRRKEKEISGLQKELCRIEQQIETIQNDPNQLQFAVVDGELVLDLKEGEALVS